MDIFKRMFALIGENGQGIGTSSFGHWVKNVGALTVSSDERFAVDGLIDDCYAQLDEGINITIFMAPFGKRNIFNPVFFFLVSSFHRTNSDWCGFSEQRRFSIVFGAK